MNALRQVFIWRADKDLFNATVSFRTLSSRSQCVVGFKFDHRPDYDSQGPKCYFEGLKLSEEIGVDPFICFVAWVKFVAEGLNDVVGCYPEVGNIVFKHPKDGANNASGSPDLETFGRFFRWHREEMAEQFVGAVEKKDVHDFISKRQQL
ncbi:MAG: hypothetical protein MK364_21370 [Pirellulales bacterium]|nr:hypothetical protein [Pirellulales bacterium]